MTKCHWDAAEGWLTAEHVRDCEDHACGGCKPCGDDHCGMRGRCANHVQAGSGIITCGSCIGKVRADLAAIVDLYAVGLHEEAEDAGVESEAFVLIGPAALPQAVDYRRGFCEIVYDKHGRPQKAQEYHPYAVLGEWDDALRQQYGPPTDLAITVTRAADYLTGLLAGAFPHGDEFEDFSRAIAACRSHLEQVIHDSRTPERGRHCPRCVELNGSGPRLRKRYAPGDDERTSAGEYDTWHCPAVSDHWWTERDYRDRVAADYEKYADRLTASAIARLLGVKAGTVRQWAARGKVRKRGTDQQGRVLYDVADAREMA